MNAIQNIASTTTVLAAEASSASLRQHGFSKPSETTRRSAQDNSKPVTAQDLMNAVKNAVKQSNQQLEQSGNNDISFGFVKELNQLVVKVVNKSTGEVIKEFPPQDLIDARLRIRKMVGLILNRVG